MQLINFFNYSASSIFMILTAWRQELVAITGDIKKMFNQI